MNADRSPRVKVCGVTRPGDAAMVAAAGAHYVGVILSPGFGRSVTLARAAQILTETGRCAAVGVFVDAGAADVARAADALGLEVVQLHGAEPIAVARELAGSGARIWKAVRPRRPGDVRDALAHWGGLVDGLLVDGYAGAAAGGAGIRFDWAAAAQEWSPGPGPERIVAGGLRPENVADAIRALAPDVVDVSSGVELAHGRKDPALVGRFLAAARRSGPGGPGAGGGDAGALREADPPEGREATA